MRARLGLLLGAVLAASIAHAAPAASTSDCGAAGDAGDTRGAASPIEPAAWYCTGDLHEGDDDWFVFTVTGGHTLVADYSLALGGNDENSLEFIDPDGVVVARNPELEDGPYPFTKDGTWAIHIHYAEPVVGSRTYRLTFWTREANASGTNEQLVTTLLPGRGLAGLGGPGSFGDGFDGTWVRLPEVADGGESVETPLTSRVHFYDESLRELPVATDGCRGDCGVPSGAAWALAQGSPTWAFTFRY